jgi:hypothetical protein
MQNEYIDRLLQRYWNCETTVAEEQELRDFFSREDLPEAWQPYAPLFAYVRDEQAVTLSDGFDDRLKAAMDKETAGTKKYITIRIFAPLLRVAASVLLIVGLGASIFFITRENNKPWFVETYDDPNAALKDATYALEMLSQALQTTEEASLQTIRMIDDLDIDWSALDTIDLYNEDDDSLSSTAPGGDTLRDDTFMPTGKKEDSI